jgi:GNAT superfamily N-acetyltransferase
LSDHGAYLSGLAVDEGHQRQGIGRQLIWRRPEAVGLHTTLILPAAPKAQASYPHVGWIIPRQAPGG